MQAIINRLQAGDEQAFTLIFNTYWKKLFAAAYKRMEDEQLAQDITQEVFMQLWDRKASLHLNADTLEFYLLKSIKNKVINHFTSSQVKRSVLEKLARRMETTQPETYNPKRYEELEAYLTTQIDQFPHTMKAVFIMRSNQLSIGQIAAALNVAEQTVKNNITKALDRLRKLLHEKFTKEDCFLLLVAIFLLTIS